MRRLAERKLLLPTLVVFHVLINPPMPMPPPPLRGDNKGGLSIFPSLLLSVTKRKASLECRSYELSMWVTKERNKHQPDTGA